jgi:hypothetical protein
MKDRLIALLKPQVDPQIKLSAVSMFIAKIIDGLDGRVVSLEGRQLQRGEKGEKGERGADGKDGKQGIAGPIGPMGMVGPEGKPGADGKTGKAGKAGVSVVDAEIAADDHLVLKLSNGNIIDAGELPNGAANLQQIINTQVSTIDNDAAAELTGGGETTLHTHPSTGGTEVISGTTTVTFGSRATDAKVTVAAPAITGGKVTKAWIFPAATASNTIDNHWVEDLHVVAGNVVAGVGFTIYASCKTGLAHGIYTVGWEYI